MSPRPLTDRQNTFSGGLNGDALSAFGPSDAASVLNNVRLVRSMEMAKRPGFKLVFTPTAGKSVGGIAWKRTPFVANTIYWSEQGGGTTTLFNGEFSSATGLITSAGSVALAAGASQVGASAVVFNSGPGVPELYLSSLGTKVYKSTGAALAAATPSDVSYLWVYNQRLFGVSFSSSFDTIYWSALGLGDTLGDVANGGGFAVVDSVGHDRVLGGMALGASNVLVLENQLAVFRGLTFDDIAVSTGMQGLAADMGPVVWNGEFAFPGFGVVDNVGYVVTTKGLYYVTETEATPYKTALTYDPMAELFKTGQWQGAGVMVLNNARAGEIWFVVSQISGSTRQLIYIYNKKLRKFTGHVDLGSSLSNIRRVLCATATGDVNHYPQLLFSLQINPSVANTRIIAGLDFSNTALEQFTDNGTAYESYIQTKRFFTSSPSTIKSWRRVNVQTGKGGLGAEAYGGSNPLLVKFVAPNSLSTSFVTAANTCVDDASNDINVGGTGPYLDVQVTDNSGTVDWSILKVEAEGFDLGNRGY